MICFIIVIGLIAAFVQGSIGFGYGLVAMAFMGLWLNVPDASAYTVIGALTVNCIMLWRLRKHIKIREHIPIITSVLIGAPIGVLLLARSNAQILYLLLGLVLVGSTLHMFFRESGKNSKKESSGWHSVYAGIPCGIISGALSGAFGTGGPPVVAYVASKRYNRFQYAATVQFILAASTIVRLFEMLRHEILTPAMVPVALMAAFASGIGAVSGIACLHRIPERIFRPMIILFLFILGIKNILQGMFF